MTLGRWGVLTQLKQCQYVASICNYSNGIERKKLIKPIGITLLPIPRTQVIANNHDSDVPIILHYQFSLETNIYIEKDSDQEVNIKTSLCRFTFTSLPCPMTRSPTSTQWERNIVSSNCCNSSHPTIMKSGKEILNGLVRGTDWPRDNATSADIATVWVKMRRRSSDCSLPRGRETP